MTDDLGASIGRIAGHLEAAAIPYMVVGSIAALVHGRARATMDVDMVIDPDAAALRAFVSSLPSQDYYVSLEAAVDALRRRSQFNVLDQDSGWKIDLLIRKARRFSREEFERRQLLEAFGRRLSVASLEDVIVAKLEWAELGASQRQTDDVRALVELAGARLDRPYVQRQVTELGLDLQWHALLASLGEGA
jgi:hypothetical protein